MITNVEERFVLVSKAAKELADKHAKENTKVKIIIWNYILFNYVIVTGNYIEVEKVLRELEEANK